MDAPRLSRLQAISLLVSCFALAFATSGHAASARSQNFLVSAATQELANEVARAAEKYRHDLAIEWLGHELPNWEQPCPITVKVSPRMGAGGATSFMFGNRKPYGWTMEIFGPEDRVLDSVLPHEVTHTIFATHFGRPLPRWADEGACTTVEHASERGKQEKLLYQFLTTNRGIAFNKMFAMTEYPRDILPLYSQGYALARYLIALEDKQTFVKYVGEGMDTNNWTAATRKYYGFHSLSDLQLSWLDWIRKKTPAIKDATDVLYVSTNASLNGRTLAEIAGKAPPADIALARNERLGEDLARRESESSERAARPAFTPLNGNTSSAKPSSSSGASNRPPANQLPPEQIGETEFASAGVGSMTAEPRPTGDGWYARRRDQARPRGRESVAMQGIEDRGASSADDHFTSASRPQPPEQVRRTILEWKRDQQVLAPAQR